MNNLPSGTAWFYLVCYYFRDCLRFGLALGRQASYLSLEKDNDLGPFTAAATLEASLPFSGLPWWGIQPYLIQDWLPDKEQ